MRGVGGNAITSVFSDYESERSQAIACCNGPFTSPREEPIRPVAMVNKHSED